MRFRHSFWVKTRQTSATIELETLFNEYWNSTEDEFVVPGQLYPQSSPHIPDRKGQRSSSLGDIVALLNCDSMYSPLSVSLYLPVQVN